MDGPGSVGPIAGLWGAGDHPTPPQPEGLTWGSGPWAGGGNPRLLGRAIGAGRALRVSGQRSHVANHVWQKLATSFKALLEGAKI